MLHPDQPAGVRFKSDDATRDRHRRQHTVVFADDRGTRIRVVGPFGHPLEPECGVQAVEIRNPGQQSVRMLTNEIAQGALPEFHDGGGEWNMSARASAFTRKLAEGTVDDGESGGFGSHSRNEDSNTWVAVRRQNFLEMNLGGESLRIEAGCPA